MDVLPSGDLIWIFRRDLIAVKKDLQFDVIGIGLNSVDFLCSLPRFPEPDTKTGMIAFDRQGGGQAATAMVACARLGLRVGYAGAIGDDAIGELSVETLRCEGVNVEGVVVKPGLRSQCAIVLIDDLTGERTIVWDREVQLETGDIRKEWVTQSRCLLVDGHNISEEIRAARWAREAGLPVVVDAEQVKEGMEELVALCTYVIGSKDFPSTITGLKEPREALEALHKMGPKVVGMTLGREGVIAYDGGRHLESPGFKVQAVDTTGAGDVFHAGICYGAVQGWALQRMLEFSNALAALSCLAVGGRAGIPGLDEVEVFLKDNLCE